MAVVTTKCRLARPRKKIARRAAVFTFTEDNGQSTSPGRPKTRAIVCLRSHDNATLRRPCRADFKCLCKIESASLLLGVAEPDCAFGGE